MENLRINLKELIEEYRINKYTRIKDERRQYESKLVKAFALENKRFYKVELRNVCSYDFEIISQLIRDHARDNNYTVLAIENRYYGVVKIILSKDPTWTDGIKMNMPFRLYVSIGLISMLAVSILVNLLF